MLRIGHNEVVCEKIEAKAERVHGESVLIRTLSPIACYSQMRRTDGRKYTVYFSPREADFRESVDVNLRRKYRALYPERAIPEGKVSIEPVGDVRERVAKFNESSSFPVKGWEGTFRLSGPEALLQMAVDAGVGAKGSSGWGAVEPV